jgi:AmiR/NasT family two-component response regulator
VALAEQETPVRLTPSLYTGVHAPAVDGVALTRMLPIVSTATHRALLAQETPTRSLPESMVPNEVQVVPPSVL